MVRRLKMNRSNGITFEEGFIEYLDDCRARNLRDATIKHYKESYSAISKFVEPNTQIHEFTKSTVDKFVIAAKNTLTITDMTLYTYARDLKTLLYYFMKCEYMPMFKIKLPHVDKPTIEAYNDSELAILLKKPNMKSCSFTEYKHWVLVNFLLSTGVRLNSFVNIKIKDLDFNNEVVNIRVTKNRKPLIIPLNKPIIKILKEYIKVRQYESEEDFLFCNIFGKQLSKNTISLGLRSYNQSRGIKTGIHRYRHTFAKKWIMAGGSVTVLQKILGHSSLAITENYINLLTEDLKKHMNDYNILDEFATKRIKLKK